MNNHMFMKIFFLSLFYTSCISFLSAQWSPTNGPSSRTIPEVYFVHDSTHYLSIRGCGIFTSDSKTNNWELKKSFWFDKYTLKGDSLFASIRELRGGIIREDDLFFIDMKKGIDETVHLNPINPKILLHSDSCLYGTTGWNFFKLSFDGKTLEYFKEGLPQELEYHINGEFYYAPILSIELAPNLIYCGTEKGIYVSNSTEYKWRAINNGLPIGNVTSIKVHKNHIYCSIGKDLYRSADSGNNWNLMFSANSKINSIFLQDEEVYLCTVNNGVLFSDDQALNWKPLNIGLPEMQIKQIESFGSKLICQTSNSGVYYFENEEWKSNNDNTNCSIIREITQTNSTIYSVDWEGVHKLNQEEIWQTISPSTPSQGFGDLNANNNDLFLSVGDVQNYLLYSSNSGNTWNQFSGVIPFEGDDTYFLKTIGDTLYAFEDDKAFYTYDFGESWTDVSIPNDLCNYFTSRIVFQSNLYASTCGSGELIKLENDNWVLKNFGLPLENRIKHLLHNNEIILAIFKDKSIARSCDFGDSWHVIGHYPDLPDIIRDFTSYNSIIFIASEQGVQYSLNNGESWIAYNDGLINSNTYSILVRDDTLYAGTAGNGVWKRTVDIREASQNNCASSAPKSILISPNPINDRMTVTQDLTNAKLCIFDVFGKLITCRKALHMNIIDTSEFSIGTYIIQVSNEHASINAKFIVVR